MRRNDRAGTMLVDQRRGETNQRGLVVLGKLLHERAPVGEGVFRAGGGEYSLLWFSDKMVSRGWQYQEVFT